MYAPTSASTDDETEEFYYPLESTIDQVKPNEVLVVMGILPSKKIEKKKKLYVSMECTIT